MFTRDATLPHAWARDPSRQLKMAECLCKLFLPMLCGGRACRTSCNATARTCAHHQPDSPLAAVPRILFVMLERGSTPLAHQPMPRLFLHVHPWRSPTAPLSAPPAAASTRYNSDLACVLCFFATNLARTLGFLGCPLSVSAHPVSMGTFPVSREHAHLPVKPPAFVVIPMPTYPQDEQFLLIVVHEFPHFILHVTCSFFVVFMNNPANPLCIFGFLRLFPRLQLLLANAQAT